MWNLGEDLQGDVSLATLEDVDRLLMRQSLEGLAVHANDLKVEMKATHIAMANRARTVGCLKRSSGRWHAIHETSDNPLDCTTCGTSD